MSMGKPGVDAAVANLHIGMALARAGDKAGAHHRALTPLPGSRAGDCPILADLCQSESLTVPVLGKEGAGLPAPFLRPAPG